MTPDHNGQKEDGPIKEKAVPGLDEDTATMSIEAARNALARSRVDPQQIPGGLGRQREPPIRGQGRPVRLSPRR